MCCLQAGRPVAHSLPPSQPAYGPGSSSQQLSLSQAVSMPAAQRPQEAPRAATEIDLCAELLNSDAADGDLAPALPPAKRAGGAHSPAKRAERNEPKKQPRRFKPLLGHDEAMLVTPSVRRASGGVASPDQAQPVAAVHVRNTELVQASSWRLNLQQARSFVRVTLLLKPAECTETASAAHMHHM